MTINYSTRWFYTLLFRNLIVFLFFGAHQWISRSFSSIILIAFVVWGRTETYFSSRGQFDLQSRRRVYIYCCSNWSREEWLYQHHVELIRPFIGGVGWFLRLHSPLVNTIHHRWSYLSNKFFATDKLATATPMRPLRDSWYQCCPRVPGNVPLIGGVTSITEGCSLPITNRQLILYIYLSKDETLYCILI